MNTFSLSKGNLGNLLLVYLKTIEENLRILSVYLKTIEKKLFSIYL